MLTGYALIQNHYAMDVKGKVQNRFCTALKRLSGYKFWKVHAAVYTASHIALSWDMDFFFWN